MEDSSAEGIYASTVDFQFCHDQAKDQGLTLYPASQSFSYGLLDENVLDQDVTLSNPSFDGMGGPTYQSLGYPDPGEDTRAGGTVRLADIELNSEDSGLGKRPGLFDDPHDSLMDGLAEEWMSNSKLIGDGVGNVVESQFNWITDSTYNSNRRSDGLPLEPFGNSCSQISEPITAAKVLASQPLKQNTEQHVISPSTCPTSGDLMPSTGLGVVTSTLGHSGYPGLDTVVPNNTVPRSQDLVENPRVLNNDSVTPLPRGQRQILGSAHLPTPSPSTSLPSTLVNGLSPLARIPSSLAHASYPVGATSTDINDPSLANIPSSLAHASRPASAASTIINEPSPLTSSLAHMPPSARSTRLPADKPAPSLGPSPSYYNQEIFPHPMPPFVPTPMYKRLFDHFTERLSELRWYQVANLSLGQQTSVLEKRIEKEKERSRVHRAERDKYRNACTEWLGIVPNTGKSMVETVRLELATKAKELASAIKDKEKAIDALTTETNKNRELETRLGEKEREIEQLKLSLAQTSDRTVNDAQGSTQRCNTTGSTGISSTQSCPVGKGNIPPSGRLTLLDSGQRTTNALPPSANSSQITAVVSAHSRPPAKGSIPPGGRLILPGSNDLVLPGSDQSATDAHPPAIPKCLPGKGDILPNSNQSATAASPSTTRESLRNKRTTHPGDRLTPAGSGQSAITGPPSAAVPSHITIPTPTTTPRPQAKRRHRTPKPRSAAPPTSTTAPSAAPEQPVTSNASNCQQERAQIARDQMPFPTQQASPPVMAIDLTTPPSSPTKKRKRDYAWMTSNKFLKLSSFPSSRRISRKATVTGKTHTLKDGEGRVNMEAELEREMMESGDGQEEIGQRDKGEDLADLEEELEREMMEGGGGGVEPQRKEESSDPLIDGPLDCNDEVDSLFGDPLDSEL
ncbi:MAG: hypothetical protein M1813_009394 [Trichoglossum hirsutum]|nr:MAG: hypothetical protein M1813_009394 [Trichoglossum hirsutum]